MAGLTLIAYHVVKVVLTLIVFYKRDYHYN